jgi:predicted nucleic acid-binding protein
MMTIADLAAGDAVFLDANIFIYHFIAEPTYGAACTSLLERIDRRELEGWTSSHVLAEVSHRLMTLEACSVFGWPYQGIASRLRRHPQELQQLGRFRQALAEIALVGLNVIVVTEQHITEAADASLQYGLLTNDALLVTLMLSRGLIHLASNDDDFDRVPRIGRYAPL